MGICTKGVVVTACKDVLFVVSQVEAALKSLLERNLVPNAPRLEQLRQLRVDIDCNVRLGLFYFRFFLNEEMYQLALFFECDSDHKDKGPQSLSMSLGARKDSVLIMRTALRALSVLGPTYLNEADCIDAYQAQEGWSTFAEQMKEGAKPFSVRSLEKWVQVFDRGDIRSDCQTFEAAFGFTRQQALAVMALDSYEARTAALTALVCGVPA